MPRRSSKTRASKYVDETFASLLAAVLHNRSDAEHHARAKALTSNARTAEQQAQAKALTSNALHRIAPASKLILEWLDGVEDVARRRIEHAASAKERAKQLRRARAEIGDDPDLSIASAQIDAKLVELTRLANHATSSVRDLVLDAVFALAKDPPSARDAAIVANLVDEPLASRADMLATLATTKTVPGERTANRRRREWLARRPQNSAIRDRK